MPLTDPAIRNAKPRERPYKLGDASGLYLLVTPSAGKWWRLKYRFGGKAKLLSFAVYPQVSLKKVTIYLTNPVQAAMLLPWTTEQPYPKFWSMRFATSSTPMYA
jgi:hypothetical protein